MPRKLRAKLITLPWELEVPTLTLASLAAVTPEEYFDVCIVDTLRERLVLDEPTDLVGITASTPRINAAYALAAIYRRMGAKVVIGGHHVTALPGEGLQHADAVVRGEGETAWMRICDQMLINPSRVSGIYCDEPPDLSTLPQPRMDLMKIHRYQPFFYPLIASRGCPEACSFCFAKQMAHGYRTYPIRHVLEQVRRRPSWTISLYFVDDNLAGDIEYTRELLRQLRKYDVHFGMQVRYEFSQNPEDLRLAVEAGCALLNSGYESVNQKTLDGTNKRANAALYKDIIKNVQREGMIASGNWMFGFDSDSPDIFSECWDLLRDSQMLHATFTTEIPFPGTAAFHRYRREGRILTTDYDQYVGKERVVARPRQMTPEQLSEGVRWLTRQYWSLSHRHQLAKVAARATLVFPKFQGWSRLPLLAVLNYYQAVQWRYRTTPSLRWLALKLMKANKYRFLKDLLRGTNYWKRDFEPFESSAQPPLASDSPFIDSGGWIAPGQRNKLQATATAEPQARG